jgi:hypothetical protein
MKVFFDFELFCLFFYAKSILTAAFVHSIISGYRSDKNVGASMENTL